MLITIGNKNCINKYVADKFKQQLLLSCDLITFDD